MTAHRTWRDVLRDAAAGLANAGVEGAARDARLLAAHVLGVDPAELIARDLDTAQPAMLAAFEAAVLRRLGGEPVSRVRGWREFYGRRFSVTPAVLDPRPETELLVEQGLARLPHGGRVLDLGTGSGCILVSILAERPDASGVGVDLSPNALAVAQANARALGVANRAAFIEGGWETGGDGFDLIVSNPPYIGEDEAGELAREVREHDPHLALFGGRDGLDPYRVIPAGAAAGLRPGGWLGVETGARQARDVARLMAEAGFADTVIFPDLAGISRAVFGRLP